MICECCKSSIDDHALFCMYCGNGMTKQGCPNCGALMPEVAIYCSDCGTKIYDNQSTYSSLETFNFEEKESEDEYENEVYEDEAYEDEVYEDEVYEDELYEDKVYEDEENVEYVNEEKIVTNIPTLNNYKDLGFLVPVGYGYIENFKIALPYSDDTYLSVYDKWCSSYEKCNLYNLISYKIIEDGIFYATRNEAVFLHKSGLHFNINIENICGVEFENDIFTITHIVSHYRIEDGYMLAVNVAKKHYNYDYIYNNMHC